MLEVFWGLLGLFVLIVMLVFGIRLNYHAVKAVFDSLDEVSGRKSPRIARWTVTLLMLILCFGSCASLLLLEMLIVVIRANKAK